MAARPLVLPDPYNGDGSWTQWEYHFLNIATVNDWDDANKLKWLKVRLTARAQIAFQRLPEATRASFDESAKALRERFEPKTRKTRYQAEMQTRRKRKTESWADLAEDLRMLADKAYPEMEDKARERLALIAYLAQLENPHLAFGVKQTNPESLDAAVSSTLELESYLSPKMSAAVSSVGVEPIEKDSASIGSVSSVSNDKLLNLIEKLVDRVERLEKELGSEQRQNSGKRSVTCYQCGERGHTARYCSVMRSNQDKRPAVNMVMERELNSEQTLHISSVSAGGYLLKGRTNEVETNFTLDTGSATTILREDTWWRVNAAGNLKLSPCRNKRLVSVTGDRLCTLGQADVGVQLGDQVFPQTAIIVRGLTTEAILGIDFLTRNGAKIDLAGQSLLINEQRVVLHSSERKSSQEVDVENHETNQRSENNGQEEKSDKTSKNSKKNENRKYRVGDRVSVRRSSIKKSHPQSDVCGPYIVVKEIAAGVYRVRHFRFSRDRKVVKLERLKPGELVSSTLNSGRISTERGAV